ncbi:MAG: cyclic nucleotide-binding domain-containing protein, partial [Deltaproteobacteria bacterium]|nr:cyclic nucleotide-binding domain-containing protein [Deltaproteobacteria bacterium]
MKPNSLLEKLRAVPLFRGLHEPELLDILRSATLRTFGKGTVVVREGEPGTSLFIVLKGKTRVSALHAKGAE